MKVVQPQAPPSRGGLVGRGARSTSRGGGRQQLRQWGGGREGRGASPPPQQQQQPQQQLAGGDEEGEEEQEDRGAGVQLLAGGALCGQAPQHGSQATWVAFTVCLQMGEEF